VFLVKEHLVKTFSRQLGANEKGSLAQANFYPKFEKILQTLSIKNR